MTRRFLRHPCFCYGFQKVNNWFCLQIDEKFLHSLCSNMCLRLFFELRICRILCVVFPSSCTSFSVCFVQLDYDVGNSLVICRLLSISPNSNPCSVFLIPNFKFRAARISTRSLSLILGKAMKSSSNFFIVCGRDSRS